MIYREIVILISRLNILILIVTILWIFPHDSPEFNESSSRENEKLLSVEIWSKSAIGQYVWESILAGQTEPIPGLPGNLYLEGTKIIDHRIRFKFRTGPSLKLQSLRSFSVENLILILNWRSQEKIDYAVRWLDAVIADPVSTIRNVGIIALGAERCNNSWFIQQYLHNDTGSGSNLRFIFIVYDWRLIDNQFIFQWPLGVATYRNFPAAGDIDLHSKRPYLCNFFATIYPGSTRQELRQLFDNQEELGRLCLVRTRSRWQPDETDQSMADYVQALQSSELTLSPVGLNHECYRILEAVEYGSIPVIEVNQKLMNNGQHECHQTEVLRLFQETGAPFIYVSNWTLELPNIIRRQQDLSYEEKVKQRIQLIKWYHRFKLKMKNRLVDIIWEKFSPSVT